MLSDKPFLVGRLGGNECNIVFRQYQESDIYKYSIRERIAAWTVAGIFPPTRHNLKKFSKLYMNALENSDCLAEWPSGLQPSVDFISNSLDSKVPRIRFGVLDIFDCAEHVAINELWIQSLEKKSVLVVHPFSESFSKQMSRINEVHKTPILPNFKATFYAPPQSNGLKISMKSYVKNLEICMREIDLMSKKTTFDFALIAAGGYGLPLASFLKNLGISSIYVGGALQLYFGVLGNRWKDRPNLSEFRTKNWLEHPLEKPPRGFQLVENGSYW